MRVFGLTGGIASGKSTVSRMFRELGAQVVDADEVARAIVAPGSAALAELVAAFGPEVLGPDGALDRKRLGARVFVEPAARARLNAITHPRIAVESARRLAALAAAGVEVALYEAPLLVENDLHRGLAGVILVAVPEPVQRARLRAREGLSEEEAAARLAAQLPLAAKLAVADHVIYNSGSLEETRRQVAAVWRALAAR